MTSEPTTQNRVDLLSIDVSRFKAAYTPGSIPLSDFNVIIGRNGSGKSTLIEALQWIDSTLRRDAVEACKRYFGIHDLLNLRSQASPPYFEVKTNWRIDGKKWAYALKVQEDTDGITPSIINERLRTSRNSRAFSEIEAPESTDRLTLSRPPSNAKSAIALRDFWRHAVFLRLSPGSLAQGSLARRSTTDPLLDEEGKNLPALLNELGTEERTELIRLVTSVLADIQNVTVSGNAAGRNDIVHYVLHEKMPYQGRTGRALFPIPAWMLSEGTRRITAIFALLVHRPAPSLLCLEEVENGLDPWSVIKVLQHLQSAAAATGTQVILTTHSPWVLDHVPLDSIIYVQRISGSSEYRRFMQMPKIAQYAADIPAGTRYTLEGLHSPMV
jgi:predicted ATPase